MRLNKARLAHAALIFCWLLLLATGSAALASAWWVFELFVHFRVQYVVAGIVLTIALWLFGRKRFAVLAALLAAINAAAVLPLLFTSAQAGTASTGGALHVVALNVYGHNRSYDRVFDYVKAEHPDVLVLLEITPEWGREIERIRGDYAFSWIRPTGLRSGIAVLTREQPIAVREIDLGATAEPALLVSMHREGEPPLAVLGAHLYWPLGPHVSEVRNRQLVALARLAAAHQGPLLIAGDLNVTSFSPHFTALLREGNLRSCGDGIEPTWPARMPFLFIQIDHCLVTREVTVEDFRGGAYVGSDHYPVSMRVRAAPAGS
jgi:endonuclease/exonuclease/phosphatase (EEP) superfamily protein YafD